MLIQHMSELRPEGLGDDGGRDEDVSDLMQLYRASKQRFDAEEDFKTRAREAVTRLQSGASDRRSPLSGSARADRPSPRLSRSPRCAVPAGDEVCLKAWRRICAASRKEFQALYDRMGVRLTERGESFYNPFLKPLVEELKERGIAELSDGATCIFIEGYKVPLIIQKSDGGFGCAMSRHTG